MIVKEFIVDLLPHRDLYYIGYIRNGHFKALSVDALTRYFGIETLSNILGENVGGYYNYNLLGYINKNIANNICKDLNLLLITEALKENYLYLYN